MGSVGLSEMTKGEALALINATRLTFKGKVGFKWLDYKLSQLAAYIEATAAENERLTAENERLNAYLDESNACQAYDS